MLHAIDVDTASNGEKATRTAVSASTSAATPAVETPDGASAPTGCEPCEYARTHGVYPTGPLTEGSAGHCDACHQGWTGKRRCHCMTCHRTFSSTTAFDQHRRRGACLDPAGVGLIDQDGTWSWPQDARFAQATHGGGAEGPGDDREDAGRPVSPRKPIRSGPAAWTPTAGSRGRLATVSAVSGIVDGEAA